MNGDKPRQLTKKQKAAARVWLSCPTQAEVARRINVRRDTVSDWMQQPHFVEAVRSLENQAQAEAMEQIRKSQSRAVEVLFEQLENEDARVAQSAAVHLLKLAGLYTEQTAALVDAKKEITIRYVNNWQDETNMRVIRFSPAGPNDNLMLPEVASHSAIPRSLQAGLSETDQNGHSSHNVDTDGIKMLPDSDLSTREP